MKYYTIQLRSGNPVDYLIRQVNLVVVCDLELDEDHNVIIDYFQSHISGVAKQLFTVGYFNVEVFNEAGSSVEFETRVN